MSDIYLAEVYRVKQPVERHTLPSYIPLLRFLCLAVLPLFILSYGSSYCIPLLLFFHLVILSMFILSRGTLYLGRMRQIKRCYLLLDVTRNLVVTRKSGGDKK
jgi:hypothetical protein